MTAAVLLVPVVPNIQPDLRQLRPRPKLGLRPEGLVGIRITVSIYISIFTSLRLLRKTISLLT